MPTAAVAPRLLVAEAEYVLEQDEEAGSRLGSDDKSAIDGGFWKNHCKHPDYASECKCLSSKMHH